MSSTTGHGNPRIGDWEPTDEERRIVRKACTEAGAYVLCNDFALDDDVEEAIAQALGRRSLTDVVHEAVYVIIDDWERGRGHFPGRPEWWGEVVELLDTEQAERGVTTLKRDRELAELGR